MNQLVEKHYKCCPVLDILFPSAWCTLPLGEREKRIRRVERETIDYAAIALTQRDQHVLPGEFPVIGQEECSLKGPF
jgi:hypothetical protein